MAAASIDITIPVLNEEGCVRWNVTTLGTRLDAQCPYPWTITVVDNGSTDDTWRITEESRRKVTRGSGPSGSAVEVEEEP